MENLRLWARPSAHSRAKPRVPLFPECRTCRLPIAFPGPCYHPQHATSAASGKKKDRSSVLDLIVGISSRAEEGKHVDTEEEEEGASYVCGCVYPPFHGAWSTRRRYNLKLCAQKHVTISRLRGTCSVYVRLLSLSLSPSSSLSVLLSAGKGRRWLRIGGTTFLSTIFLPCIWICRICKISTTDDTYHPLLLPATSSSPFFLRITSSLRYLVSLPCKYLLSVLYFYKGGLR